MNITYLDNAATSWPKPNETMEAMENYNRSIGGSPGRSGHRLSIEAGRIIFNARESLTQLFEIDDPLRIIFTKNATEALNLAIFGLFKPGEHVITSSMEHNSVMRPLRFLESQGLELSVIQCSPRGEIDPANIKAAIRKNSRAVILTHASNVTGTIMPLCEVGLICREHELVFVVDAAQSAGAIPINVDQMNIDILAFTGHKSLFGPQGTGGLYIREGIELGLRPLMMGGTGSKSEFEEQPEFLPDKYESGTLNTIGIAGLGGGALYLCSQGIEVIRKKEEALVKQFLDGLQTVPGIKIYGTGDASRQTPVVAFNVKGMAPSETALAFDESFGIMSRPGLHCAPAAHRTIGTFPMGANRFSFGYFNTPEQVLLAIEAVEKVSRFNYSDCNKK